jgi:hypothetical protein
VNTSAYSTKQWRGSRIKVLHRMDTVFQTAGVFGLMQEMPENSMLEIIASVKLGGLEDQWPAQVLRLVMRWRTQLPKGGLVSSHLKALVCLKTVLLREAELRTLS